MRGRVGAALLFLWVACGDDDDSDKLVTDASVRLDGRANVMDAMLMERCGPAKACQNGAIVTLPELCIGSVSAQPSGGTWQVCAIDPQGKTQYVEVRADERITSPGWTFSNYAFVDSTLSDEGYAACIEERSKLIVATELSQPDGGNDLCFRPTAAIGTTEDEAEHRKRSVSLRVDWRRL